MHDSVCAWLRRHRHFIRLSGIAVMGLGILINLANLKGCLQDSDRKHFLQWVLTSKVGLPINDPAVQAFMKDFPPPEDAHASDLTHVTKMTIGHELRGIIQDASINYMHRDGERTAYIANLADVRAWVEQTSYPWLA